MKRSQSRYTGWIVIVGLGLTLVSLGWMLWYEEETRERLGEIIKIIWPIVGLAIAAWSLWKTHRRDTKNDKRFWQNKWWETVKEACEDDEGNDLRIALRVEAVRNLVWTAEHDQQFHAQGEKVLQHIVLHDMTRRAEIIGARKQLTMNAAAELAAETLRGWGVLTEAWDEQVEEEIVCHARLPDDM